MRARRHALPMLVAVGAAAANAAELPPPTGTGVERGVALVECETSSGLLATSRAVVVDAGMGAGVDVLLTTAHGLPAVADDVRRRCRVLARGVEHSIRQVWQARGHAADPAHDWAVLVARRIKGDIKRWRVTAAADTWLEQLVADGARVRLVLRYAAEPQTDCRLAAWTPQRLLVHTCVTYPGTSGSPLVVGAALEPAVIALHVGSQLDWDGKKLEIVSVARPLDAAVVAAVEQAAQASQPSSKRRH